MVRFIAGNKAGGQPDSIAWYLSDPTAWKRKLEELKASNARLSG
ncbi:MAG: hypothetical protein ACT4PU_07170 [Planctomycetota bacterium]